MKDRLKILGRAQALWEHTATKHSSELDDATTFACPHPVCHQDGKSEEQERALSAVRAGRTLLVVVLSTGGGKSLIFMVLACFC